MRRRSSNAQFLPRVTPNPYSAMGWRDYFAELPFPADYESWTPIQQRHYERGRLRASGAYLIYQRIPKQEPADIVERTNGLLLVPRGRR
jgi:hypothetical protein